MWTVFFSLLVLSEASADPLLNRGQALFEQGRYQDAAEVFKKLMFTEEQFSAELRVWMIKSLMLSGQLEEAEQLGRLLLFRAGQQIAPVRQEMIYLLARNLFLQERTAEARQLLIWLIREDPNHPFAIQGFYWLAEVLRRQGWREEAGQIFLLLLDNFPRHKLNGLADRGLMLIDVARIREQAVQAREHGFK